jgi:hypothetical protein
MKQQRWWAAGELSEGKYMDVLVVANEPNL